MGGWLSVASVMVESVRSMMDLLLVSYVGRVDGNEG
jgi:hypothetical protein